MKIRGYGLGEKKRNERKDRKTKQNFFLQFDILYRQTQISAFDFELLGQKKK